MCICILNFSFFLLLLHIYWRRVLVSVVYRIPFLSVLLQPIDFLYLTLCPSPTHLYLTDVFFIVATQPAPMTSLSKMTSQLCFPLHLLEISARVSTGQHWVFFSGKCRSFRIRICLFAGHTSLTSSIDFNPFMATDLILSVNEKSNMKLNILKIIINQ